jgi:hypothetical protein
MELVNLIAKEIAQAFDDEEGQFLTGNGVPTCAPDPESLSSPAGRLLAAMLDDVAKMNPEEYAAAQNAGARSHSFH